MTALIIGGGVLCDAKKVLVKIVDYNADLIIACDSGYDNAQKLGIKPQVVVGDLDSVSSEIIDTEIIQLQPEKDDTDMRVAVDLAISKQCENITILCATGGRLDHFYANMSILEYLDKQGIDAVIMDEQNVITVSKKGKTAYKNISKYVSIIPIDEKIVLTTENMKYEVQNLEVFRDNMVSISNESLENTFSLDISNGKAFVIQSDN
ncbi:MAG: thiamine diphosphokinase [Clostridia bacterium]